MELLLALLVIALVLSPFVCIFLQARSAQRIRALEQDLQRLRRELGSPGHATRETAGASGPAPQPASPPTANRPSPPARSEASRSTAAALTAATSTPARETSPRGTPSQAAPSGTTASLEAFLGGRVMLVTGVVAVLFGVAFFLRIAIDRGWIGPAARVAMGTALGSAMLVAGGHFARRGFALFGHAIMGAGLGVLFLSNFFAVVRYDLIGRPTGFLLVGSITALGAVLALRRDTRILAWLGFLGGFLAPALLGEDVDRLGALTAWLLVLDAGLLALRLRRRWPGLEILALAAATIYFLHWHGRWFVPERLGIGAWSLAAMTTAVMALCLAPALRARRAVAPTALWTTLIAGLVAYWGGHLLMFPEHRYALGTGIVVLGALQAGAGRLLAARIGARSPDAAALEAFGLAALAVAVPVLFQGHGIAPAWSALGAAAVFAGVRRESGGLESGGQVLGGMVLGGLAMIALGAGNVLIHNTPAHREAFMPFLNGGFLSVITPCAALLLAARLLEQAKGRLTEASAPVALAGLWLFTVPLGYELHGAFALHPERFGIATRETALAATAVGIAVYAGALAGLFGSKWGRGRSANRPWGVALPYGPLAAAVMLGLAILAVDRHAGFVPGLNRLFAAELTVTAACFVVARQLKGVGAGTAGAALLIGLALLLVQVTREIHAWGEVGGDGNIAREDMRFRAQVAISSAWALYAAVTLVTGFRRRRPELRWIGLGLFGLTVLKVFLRDMAALDTGYRVGSFLVLGVLLVAASYLYQHMQGSAGGR